MRKKIDTYMIVAQLIQLLNYQRLALCIIWLCVALTCYCSYVLHVILLISYAMYICRDVARVRRLVATTDKRCSIKCVHEVISYWLVTNSGGHFKLSGGWS